MDSVDAPRILDVLGHVLQLGRRIRGKARKRRVFPEGGDDVGIEGVVGLSALGRATHISSHVIRVAGALDLMPERGQVRADDGSARKGAAVGVRRR